MRRCKPEGDGGATSSMTISSDWFDEEPDGNRPLKYLSIECVP